MGCLLGSADSERNEEGQKIEQEKLNKSNQPSYSESEYSSAYVTPMRNSPSNSANLSSNLWSRPNTLQNQVRNSARYAYPSARSTNLHSYDPAKNDAKYQMNLFEFPALPTYHTSPQKHEAPSTKTNRWTKYNPDYVPLDSDYSCFLDTSSDSSSASYSFAQYKPVSNLKNVVNYKNLSNNSPVRKAVANSKLPIKSINKSQKPIKPNSNISGSTPDSSAPSKIYSEFITFILSYSLYRPKSEPIIIPNSFNDIPSYIHYFRHGFYTELNAILDQALEEAFLSNKYRLNLHVENNHASLSPSSSSELNFENEIQINDIIIIIPNQNKFPRNFEEIKENNISWILGLIDQNKVNKINILLSPDREAQFKNSKIYIAAIIGNITSLKRELSVLDKIKRFSLLRQILSPQWYEPLIKCRLTENIQDKYNQSQLEAIVTSINSDGKIALIQGPPGTGKTRTVAGILSGLYAYNRKLKVLICAQSNAAVDEIAWTVLKEGILDEDGNKRSDISLLRVGEKRQKHELGVEEDIKTSKEIEMGINSIKINVLVEEKLNKEDLYDPTFNIKKLIEKLEKLEEQYKELVEKRAKYGTVEIEIKIEELSCKVESLKEKRTLYFSKKTIYMAELIRAADIVFCTLSGAGSISLCKILIQLIIWL
ncbi:unnamed protein product [Blepharisma stoltei]|uniref:DNA2/NAM7 helicase helicase domain-containing protein n=1 Tax=Blepharisma stoltei TaxID=1481888 RepID=A0AAU9JWW7_9CILI|nr:unnamed protein product [Blepharisma stoltei]